MVIRWVVTVVAFLVGVVAGVLVVGSSLTDYEAALRAFPIITVIAVLAAFAGYAVVEYLQTGSLASIGRQFGTRTIVLIPIAIAINVILGQTVAAALKIPVYLDSIGTILVGALAGPIPGALTGMLANLLWTYVLPPPFHSDFAAPFAITAVVIGLLAGLAARGGLMRPRPDSGAGSLIMAGAIALIVTGGLAAWTYTQFYGGTFTFFNPEPGGDVSAVFILVGWLIAALVVVAVAGFIALLAVRRDAAVAYVVVAGAITGVISAILSAPIAANLFGGVTGAGTDFLVAFFREQGADVLGASFQQGLISDPIDKITTFLVVYLILLAMARRTKARFPQGERLIEASALAADGGEWREAAT